MCGIQFFHESPHQPVAVSPTEYFFVTWPLNGHWSKKNWWNTHQFHLHQWPLSGSQMAISSSRYNIFIAPRTIILFRWYVMR